MNYEPEDFARSLLAELKIKRADNPEAVAARLRLRIEEVDFENLEGALVFRVDRAKGIISINKNIREIGRRNFTICHEIAHFVLPSHGSVKCKSKEIESWSNRINLQEIEANRFASELLLPKNEIYQIINNKVSIETAKAIAKNFNTSLTATLLKCSEVTDESCAVIWSIDGRIEWVKKNENFNFFIPKKDLDNDSVAYQLFKDNSNQEGEKAVYAETWVSDDNLQSDLQIWEESISMPNYNGVLTLLSLI
ncbi:MAG: ImmA/IrrE family metallo-endopeptidase [Acidobacteria bacterium]|nr:ImmA/IrrE family metallo-endopeptidase [Acidobacteriota bacterium]